MIWITPHLTQNPRNKVWSPLISPLATRPRLPELQQHRPSFQSVHVLNTFPPMPFTLTVSLSQDGCSPTLTWLAPCYSGRNLNVNFLRKISPGHLINLKEASSRALWHHTNFLQTNDFLVKSPYLFIAYCLTPRPTRPFLLLFSVSNLQCQRWWLYLVGVE